MNRKDAATQTEDSVLTIVKKNEKGPFPYYVVRSRRDLVASGSFRNLKEKYPNMTVVHEVVYQSNGVDLFSEMKEKLTYMKTNFNNVAVPDLEKLKEDVDALVKQRG